MAPTPESIESLKHAPGVAGMVEPILHRWSPRAYRRPRGLHGRFEEGF